MEDISDESKYVIYPNMIHLICLPSGPGQAENP
jgi:hypothetical protein